MPVEANKRPSYKKKTAMLNNKTARPTKRMKGNPFDYFQS